LYQTQTLEQCLFSVLQIAPRVGLASSSCLASLCIQMDVVSYH